MITRALLVLLCCANIAAAQTNLTPGEGNFGFVNGTIQSDQVFDYAYAVTYRNKSATDTYDFLISGSVIKERALGDICFTFGKAGSISADPTRSYCQGIRKERFIAGLSWLTITNSGCAPSRINGSEGIGCEFIHLWGLSRNAAGPVFTRLSHVQGIKAVFTNRGLDSSNNQIPLITEVQYTASNQANYQTTRAAGRFRLHGTNLARGQRYALLIDGLPYSNRFPFVVSSGMPFISNPSSGGGFIDFVGYSLPEGKFSIQLVEYLRAPSSGAGPNVYSDALRPFPSVPITFYVTRGFHRFFCHIENGAAQPHNQCVVSRGIGQETIWMSDCSASSTSKSCRGQSNSELVGSTSIRTTFPRLAPSFPQQCFPGPDGLSYICTASFR